MPEYSFRVIIDGDVDAHIDELFEAGCDDATFGVVDGVHYADFDRAAPTLVDAVASAIVTIDAMPGLRVVGIEPDDVVTAAEIADRSSRPQPIGVHLFYAACRGRA